MTNPSLEHDEVQRIVRASVADSPSAPTANEIISRRAARSVDLSTGERKKPISLLVLSAGAIGAIIVAVLAFRPAGDGSELLVADSPETTSTTTEVALPPSAVTTLGPSNHLDETDSLDTTTGTTGVTPNQLAGPEIPTVTRPMLGDGRPETFWAIEDETYSLVEVDTATGEILGDYGGWGEPFTDCEDGGDCGMFQGLSDVEVGADGRLWLSDCCEPAVGNTFVVDPGDSVDPLSSNAERVLGTQPIVSPDGRLVARTTLQWIEINSTDFGSPVSWPPEAPIADGGYYRAAAWLNSTTLVVIASSLEGTGSIVLLDVSDPTSPTLIDHPAMGGLVPFVDAGVRADGTIFALAILPAGDDGDRLVEGWVYDPASGERITTTPLPRDLFSIDYDQTNTYLITAGGDGVVRWYGAGSSGEIASGFVAASW